MVWVDVSLCECKSSLVPSILSYFHRIMLLPCPNRPASEAPRLLLLVNPTGMSHQNWHSLDNQALTTHAFPLDTYTPHPARRQGPSLGGGEAQRRGPKGQGGPCSWWEASIKQRLNRRPRTHKRYVWHS